MKEKKRIKVGPVEIDTTGPNSTKGFGEIVLWILGFISVLYP